MPQPPFGSPHILAPGVGQPSASQRPLFSAYSGSNASSALTASSNGTKWPIRLSDKERSKRLSNDPPARGMRSRRTPMSDLKGKVAVVTGASKGIGAAMRKAWARLAPQ
jgi:hypothetical protein